MGGTVCDRVKKCPIIPVV